MRFFSFITCLLFTLQFGCAQRKAETCLDYSFGQEYPYAFKLYNNKIIIGNGRELIEFNESGKETGRIILPGSFMKGEVFLDFLPLSDTSYLITIYGRLFEITAKTQKLLDSNFGELLRGEFPVVATAFQEEDTLNHQTINGIKVLNAKTGKVLKYPTKADLGTNNFEVLDEYIALCPPSDSLFLLPLDTTRPIEKIHTIGFYAFIGLSHGNFVFLSRDYNKKEDHLHFYDKRMKFIKEGVLDVSFKDISDVVKKDENFYMEAPFGNFYSFDKMSNRIFVFRHTQNNTICFFPIEEHLTVIEKP